MENASTGSKCRARHVSNRQPGTRTAKTTATFGADQSGSRKGPAKARRPRVITCGLSSLAGLALGIVDRAELRLGRGAGVGRVRARGELAAVRGHGVQRARLGGGLLRMRRAHRAEVVRGLQP